MKNVSLAIVLACAGMLSCVDHAADGEAQQEQIRLDSVAQADIDNGLIDAYIADVSNGIDGAEVVVGENGIRHIVWDPTASVRTPEYSDIVSIHYLGKYLTNDRFDTSSRSSAKKSDSLDYVAEDVSIQDLLDASSKSYEELLDSLNSSTGSIESPLFNIDRTYLPIVFNHSPDGSGIASTFIPGFRLGLQDVMLKMELNGSSLIIIPSAMAYGINGTLNSDGTVGIPPNSVLMFEFDLVSIRP